MTQGERAVSLTLKEFFEQMRELLGSRYKDFIAAYETKPRYKALRVNTLKIGADEFARLVGIAEPKTNALCAQSLYTTVKPSIDPLYHAGLYYMQEPSASAAVAAFAPFIGERVLDVCAAPGGKATQAAAFMNGKGVIFANDPERKRVSALIENAERLGIKNAVVTCATAADYVGAGFEAYFDTLIVDAPCSGGGITRYENVLYTRETVAGCVKRQREILDSAARLLCCGGYMLYSTCTFSREENEDNIEYLVGKGFEPIDAPPRAGEERGIGIPAARRIYPMNFDGEGHFYCILKKTEGQARQDLPIERNKRIAIELGGLSLAVEIRNDEHIVKDFDLPRLAPRAPLYYIKVGASVYSASGAVKPREISHALSHALAQAQAQSFGTVELGELAERYIRGEQLALTAPKGQRIATVNGYALGTVKAAADGAGTPVLKNLYPKSLRI